MIDIDTGLPGLVIGFSAQGRDVRSLETGIFVALISLLATRGLGREILGREKDAEARARLIFVCFTCQSHKLRAISSRKLVGGRINQALNGHGAWCISRLRLETHTGVLGTRNNPPS